MEQNLIYLALSVILFLIIVLAVTFKQKNKLKEEYKTLDSMCDDAMELSFERKKEIADQKLFIESLNARVQKAEAELEDIKWRFEDEKMQNTILVDDLKELQDKLSRKGLGKKGTKKLQIYCDLASGKDTISYMQYIDISQIDDMSEYYGCEFQAVTQNDEVVNGFVFKANVPESHCVFLLISQSFKYYWLARKEDDDAQYIAEEFLDNGYYGQFSSILDCKGYKSFKIIKRG
jgi:hypothetical protein